MLGCCFVQWVDVTGAPRLPTSSFVRPFCDLTITHAFNVRPVESHPLKTKPLRNTSRVSNVGCLPACWQVKAFTSLNPYLVSWLIKNTFWEFLRIKWGEHLQEPGKITHCLVLQSDRTSYPTLRIFEVTKRPDDLFLAGPKTKSNWRSWWCWPPLQSPHKVHVFNINVPVLFTSFKPRGGTKAPSYLPMATGPPPVGLVPRGPRLTTTALEVVGFLSSWAWRE